MCISSLHYFSIQVHPQNALQTCNSTFSTTSEPFLRLNGMYSPISYLPAGAHSLFHSGGTSRFSVWSFFRSSLYWMLVSVSMSGQGYVSSALARYLIEYFIDTSPVDARITLVQPLGHLELDLSSSLMERRPEDKLTPVQQDGPCKGRHFQETSIPLCIWAALISYYISIRRK